MPLGSHAGAMNPGSQKTGRWMEPFWRSGSQSLPVFFLRVDNGNPVDELAAFMQVRFRRDAGRNGNPGTLTAERLS